MKITSIPQLYRNLKRWREILAVLRRYGLADWLTQFRLPFRDTFKDLGGIPLSTYSREERVRMALTELGPTFIKVGQVLAARPDMVGPKLGEALKDLRANVRPDSIETVRENLKKELGEDYESHFRFIDPKPLATASIGQVHRAVLNDGRDVVIKVQRQDIERTMRQDFDVLTGLAQLAERVEAFAAWRPADMVRQLAPMIARELDFGRERQNLEYFAQMLRKRSAEVVVPLPINRLCTRRVLVMEELHGISVAEFLSPSRQRPAPTPSAVNEPIGDRTRPSEEGTLPTSATDGAESNLPTSTARGGGRAERAKPDQQAKRQATKQRLSETIAQVYLSMLFDDGLFHADPHTDNLFLLDDGRLGILDFGMTGRIDETLRETIEDMLVVIGRGDQNRLSRLIRRIGDPPPTLDESALAIDTADFIGTYGRQTLGAFDMTGALNELTAILHKHHIKLPNQSALLLKMLISLEGTLRELGASFDSLAIVHSFLRRSMFRRLSPQRRLRQARRIYLEAESFLETAPDEVLSLMKQARRGEVRLTLEHQRLSPSINRLVLGLMTSAVFLGSSLMLAMKVPPMLFTREPFLGIKDLSILGIAGIIGSVTVMMWLLLAINRSGHLTRENDD
jgi:ubiquinone biosynthesis protein